MLATNMAEESWRSSTMPSVLENAQGKCKAPSFSTLLLCCNPQLSCTAENTFQQELAALQLQTAPWHFVHPLSHWRDSRQHTETCLEFAATIVHGSAYSPLLHEWVLLKATGMRLCT